MSAPAPPAIPPRPVKQQAAAQGVSKLPDLPPRPSSKRVERSISPSNFPRSPLNEPYTLTKAKTAEIARPPSVSHLPAPGEEGIEYANVQYTPQVPASALAQDGNTQTRTIAEDLQLHAPKPSLPKASATAQVQGVTRTDSAQAASHGFGRSSHDDLPVTRTRSQQSFSRPDSAASGERRRSVVYGDEHGPAELGLRVPINPLLGDVQAPTPQGMSPQPTGDSPLRHGRKKSKAEDFRPPDSYGLHGHGVIANTSFEREWYAKHPEQLEHEEGHGHGVYEGIGSGRGAFALSSDELNKIVRDTASRGAGLGTKENIQSYPDEQIGYNASEVYQRSQQNTPHPDPLSRMHTHESQPVVQSPLRRTSFPAEDTQPAEVRRSRIASSQGSDKAVGDDSDGAYHVDEPARKNDKLAGGQERVNDTQEAKADAGPGEEDDSHEYRAPILAEDEVAKSVGGEFLHPAVSPKFERRHSYDEHGGSGAHTPTSRPASRPSSIYQMHSASHSLSRFLSHPDDRDHVHTPLEDVAEYEPLFDESEEKKAISTAERFKKRPDALQKRFPSQDIWEDTPNSAMYVAEVSTPDLPSQVDPDQSEKSELKQAPASEPPEAEHARTGEAPEEETREQSPEERLAKSKWTPPVRDDIPTKGRPSVANRFPSQDIWEDTPDSNYLTTTVGGQLDDEQSSPVETKPPVPARPGKSPLGDGASSAPIEPSGPPQIPARPTKRVHAAPPADAKLTDPHTLSKEPSPVELKKTPSIPDQPKPQIPPRPAKKAGENSLTKVTSTGSTERAEDERAARPKPQIPARPAGGNFANLKGNFMSDLNKKLGLGPPKEKEKEPEPELEAKPLEDARKGRARGPQRRAPAKVPAVQSKPLPQFSMFSARSLWQIDESDELSTAPKAKGEPDPTATSDHATAAHPESNPDKGVVDRHSDSPAPLTSGLATNIAGEPADPTPTGDDENPEGELTRVTTASTVSGEQIDREDSNAQTHMLPVSQMTTASDDDDQSEDHLEKVQSKEPEATAEDEPIKVRNEQVNAPAPDPSNTHSVTGSKHIIANGNDKSESGAVEGEDKPKEPMNEDDIDYGKLEEMTAEADGKIHAAEDPQAHSSTRKVVD